MKSLVFLLAAFPLVVAVSGNGAFACQCQPTWDPAVEFEQVDVVFMGVVIGISQSSSPDFLDIQVAVTGYWKGSVVPIMHVYTGWFAGSCGYEFGLYEEYLIYAEIWSDECCPDLITSICNRTRPLAIAQADLEFLGPPDPVPVEEMSWGAVKEIYR